MGTVVVMTTEMKFTCDRRNRIIHMKICSECEREFKSLWKAKTKAHGALCKYCWGKYSTGEVKSLKTPKNRSGGIIKPVSDKQAIRLREYRRVRDEFLKGKTCEFPGCGSKLVELHHMCGRVGSLLTDRNYFKALCRKHHQIVELQPERAKALGLSGSRLDKK